MRSWVWNYFEKHESENDTAICNICEIKISRPNGSTSSLQSHLKRRHLIVENGTIEKPEKTYRIREGKDDLDFFVNRYFLFGKSNLV
jgi:hypothetical protein